MNQKADIRTSVSVLTGFLGSGKTTLLNRALRLPGMAKTLVVINELGEVPLDHLLVTTSNDAIVVLENGCLCCTVFGDLVQSLQRLYHAREAGEIAPFDHVVIETSGMADPTPIVQAFLSDPVLAGLYRLASVVCVLDGVNGLNTLERYQEAVRQLALADVVLISKLDLVGEGQVQPDRTAELRNQIAAINPAAVVHDSADPSLDLSELLRANRLTLDTPSSAISWLNAAVYLPQVSSGSALAPNSTRHTSGIAAYCLVYEEPTSLYGLELLLTSIEQNLGPALLRVKGLINVVEEPQRPAVIQGAQHLLHNLVWLDRWPDSDHRTRMVFITDGIGQADLEQMVSMLGKIAHRTAAARDRAQRSAQNNP